LRDSSVAVVVDRDTARKALAECRAKLLGG